MAGRFAIETVFKAVDKISKPFSKMQQRVRRGTDKITASLKKMNAPLSKFTKGLASVGKKGLIAGGGALVGGITAGTAALVLFNNEARKTVTLAESVGVSAGFLENLGTAIAPAGFELDNIVDLVEEMNNKLGESAGLKEITPVTESLAILNLRFRDLQKLSPEQQFRAITDAALKMKDAQKAAAAVDILMGGEANKIIGILRRQGKTTEEVLKAQEAYNARTDKGREGAVAFSKEVGKTTRIVSSLASEIAGLVGGQMVPMLAKMSEYIRANKDLIKTRILEFFEKLKKRAEAAWQWLNEEGRLQSIIETVIGLGSAIAAVTKFMTEHGETVAYLIGGIVALNATLTAFTAIMGIVNVLMAINPIGLIVIGVAALTAGVAALIYYWDDVKGFLKDMAPDWLLVFWDNLTTNISNTVNMMKAAFRGVEMIADKVSNLDPVGSVKGFFGFGDDEADQAQQQQGGQIVTPQERTARTIEENRTTSTAELLIKDQTGRAEMTNKRPAPGIALNVVNSGGF